VLNCLHFPVTINKTGKKMFNLILVEDNIDLASGIVDYFSLENIQCDHANNGIAGLNLICTNSYQVIILDLGLPKMDGLTLF